MKTLSDKFMKKIYYIKYILLSQIYYVVSILLSVQSNAISIKEVTFLLSLLFWKIFFIYEG